MLDEWIDYAEEVLPGRFSFAEDVLILNPSSAPLAEKNSSIPRNPSGHPVFPATDIEKMPPADVKNLLKLYFDAVWGQ